MCHLPGGRWLSIAATTVAIRVMVLPVLVFQMKATARLTVRFILAYPYSPFPHLDIFSSIYELGRQILSITVDCTWHVWLEVNT